MMGTLDCGKGPFSPPTFPVVFPDGGPVGRGKKERQSCSYGTNLFDRRELEDTETLPHNLYKRLKNSSAHQRIPKEPLPAQHNVHVCRLGLIELIAWRKAAWDTLVGSVQISRPITPCSAPSSSLFYPWQKGRVEANRNRRGPPILPCLGPPKYQSQPRLR